MPEAMKDFVTGVPVELSPAAIERELSAMWEKRADETQAEDEGVGRITLGNLVWLGTSRHVERTRQVFSRLVSRYPCRLFLLEYTAIEPQHPMEAFVNAHCFLAKGVRREVCCEEIHLRFGNEGLRLVSGAVLPLLLTDVPTTLWYYSREPEQYAETLPSLEGLADRVVTDVSWMAEPADGLRGMVDIKSRVVDLSWHRLAPYRELIASIFDDEAHGRLLDKLESVHFRWRGQPRGPHCSLHASLLAGWFASSLRWEPGVDPETGGVAFHSGKSTRHVHVEVATGSPPKGLDLVEMKFSTGDVIRLGAEENPLHLVKRVEGPSFARETAPRTLSAALNDEAESLGHALNSRSDQQLFRQAAACAWPLLRQVLLETPAQ
jgi:glucose-6-phosphate dehydrogenase assembly protein OpcA